MNKTYLRGYISVSAALLAKSRDVYRIIYDRTRFDTVFNSKYHNEEKRQYNFLKRVAKERKIKTDFMDTSAYVSLFGEDTGGIIAEVGDKKFVSDEELLGIKRPYLAILDGIEDPYNFGQVLRCFYAAGVDGIVVPERNFYTASAVVARASAGASELLKVASVSSVEEFCVKAKERGITLLATADGEGSENLYECDFERPICVIIGGERRGISKKVMALCDKTLRIEYPKKVNIALSASSAAPIIAFEIGRKIGL